MMEIRASISCFLFSIHVNQVEIESQNTHRLEQNRREVMTLGGTFPYFPHVGNIKKNECQHKTEKNIIKKEGEGLWLVIAFRKKLMVRLSGREAKRGIDGRRELGWRTVRFDFFFFFWYGDFVSNFASLLFLRLVDWQWWFHFPGEVRGHDAIVHDSRLIETDYTRMDTVIHVAVRVRPAGLVR